jgi:hypothetical protein
MMMPCSVGAVAVVLEIDAALAQFRRVVAAPTSSGPARGHGCAVDHEGSVDDVGQEASEGAQCLGLGVAGGDAGFEVSLRLGVNAHMGFCNAVDGAVELPVAGLNRAGVSNSPRRFSMVY